MPDVVIENPVINSPFVEPGRHFVFGEDRITNEIADSRRRSSYFVPIPPPKKKPADQITLGDWLQGGRNYVSFACNWPSRTRLRPFA
jgi:type III restriction enzyme